MLFRMGQLYQLEILRRFLKLCGKFYLVVMPEEKTIPLPFSVTLWVESRKVADGVVLV